MSKFYYNSVDSQFYRRNNTDDSLDNNPDYTLGEYKIAWLDQSVLFGNVLDWLSYDDITPQEINIALGQ